MRKFISKARDELDKVLDESGGKQHANGSHPGYGQNGYGGGYGYSNGGLQNQGYQNGGSQGGPYAHSPTAQQGGYNNYAPPPGPPPGTHGSLQNQHQPYGPPPPQGVYGGHQPPGGISQGPPMGYAPPGARGSMPFPQKVVMWSRMSSSGESYILVGPTLGEPSHAGRIPSLTGKLTVTGGGHKEKGPLLGEAKDSGLSGSSAQITLADGSSYAVKKSGMSSIGNLSYTFTVPVDRGGEETFQWKTMDTGFKDMRHAKSGYILSRPGDLDNPVATWTDYGGLGMHTNSEMGTIEFVGQGATGELGSTFAIMTVLSMMKAKQKAAEKEIVKAIAGEI
ncbi:uncharacterized protein F5Z01DRAFT_560325 [Emericellopsis atlantica]|uniref:Uncharacterized protein n=1 Tax=Emericellopsis atlantica TaxID=2614577 RepID=A0A9P8CQP2_9HYPO|nr:uncharacterized protein F5Z01DRAFT_560325 [Emericellopsis atlantica]KAG9255838.1 hypothetical protein F5Z01DRAFT_560325 [Emericellopsis atlantica]